MLKKVLFVSSLSLLTIGCKKNYHKNVQFEDSKEPQAQQELANKESNLQSPMLVSQPQEQNPIVPLLSEEYLAIAKGFMSKNAQKQSEYFESKSYDLKKSNLIELEIVPNDILSDTKNPRLQNLYQKESVVKDILSGTKDDSFKARILALYDCAVVDVAESVVSGEIEQTSCYDDLNTLTFTPSQVADQKTTQPSQDTQVAIKGDEFNDITARAYTIEQLKSYTEQVEKNFFVIEFEPSSYTADISYYEKFKSVSNLLLNYKKGYKITIIGYQLYDESPVKENKTPKGKIFKTKRNPKAIKAAQDINNILKTRALTVRKMFVTNGIPDENIVIAHPEASKVKYLYNVKDGPKGENILENITIIDIKLN